MGRSRRSGVGSRWSRECGLGVVAALERHSPREALVEDQAERVEVRPAVEAAAANLLGGEVLGGSHHHVVAREVAVTRRRLGDTEVGEQDPPLRGDEDVAGFDVAVDESGLVSGVERGGDGDPDPDRELRCQPLVVVEHLAEAPSGNELHHHGLSAVLVDGVVHRDDVRMSQSGYGDCLPPEPFGDHGVGCQRRFEQLHRYRTGEQFVRRQPHLGHPALRDTVFEPVPPCKERRRGRDGSSHRGQTLARRGPSDPASLDLKLRFARGQRQATV